MNYKMIFSTTGKVVLTQAVLFLICAIVSFCYLEVQTGVAFLLALIIATAIGMGFILCFKVKTHTIYSKEGLIIVAFAWIFISLIGALPFVISKDIPNYVDALFETVSGFTTTGATVVANIEGLSHGILLWRSLTHYVGGIGILVFVVAITGKSTDRSINILKAEMPGPTVDKLVPRARDTAKILISIYVGMTAIMAILLIVGGDGVFESILNALSTAGTGGFAIKNDSIAGYSTYTQWIITLFMFLFGVNFNIYFLLIAGKIGSVLKSKELWTYFIVVLLAIGIITLNIASLCSSYGEALRFSAFQVNAIVSTTGFTTCDFDLWPNLSKTILFVLMFVGGCAGSTAGGFKLSRVIMLFKGVKREIGTVLHPKTVKVIKYEGKKVEEPTMSGLGTYLALYMFIIIVVFILLSLDSSFSILSNLTATVSCFNNVGPGLEALGPTCNYGGYSAFSKVVLSFAMLFGRLEIYPLLITLLPSTWIRK